MFSDEIWSKVFQNVGDLLKGIYGDLLKKTPDLVEFISNAEISQEYSWKYIDYGFRVPVYRTMQWISLGMNIDWHEFIKSLKRSPREKPENKKSKAREIVEKMEGFLIELSKHIIKEYMLTWNIVLKHIDKDVIKNIFINVLRGNINKSDLEIAIKDIIGLAYELLACYVLADHEKPFLPFSIMQAPITPSYIRPGIASGDLYLFEENLVIDVKKGEIDPTHGVPTYYYYVKKGNKRKTISLSDDLGRISNLRYLYGIRKGIGVVAEDNNHVHFAVYVPWRRWRRDGPLLYLKSVKLPLLIYMNRIKNAGIEPHIATIKNNGINITVEAYRLKDIDLDCNIVEAKLLSKDGDEPNMVCSEIKDTDDRKPTIVLKLENVRDLNKYVFSYNNTKFLASFMTIKIKQNIVIRYPIVALVT